MDMEVRFVEIGMVIAIIGLVLNIIMTSVNRKRDHHAEGAWRGSIDSKIDNIESLLKIVIPLTEKIAVIEKDLQLSKDEFRREIKKVKEDVDDIKKDGYCRGKGVSQR